MAVHVGFKVQGLTYAEGHVGVPDYGVINPDDPVVVVKSPRPPLRSHLGRRRGKLLLLLLLLLLRLLLLLLLLMRLRQGRSPPSTSASLLGGGGPATAMTVMALFGPSLFLPFRGIPVSHLAPTNGSRSRRRNGTGWWRGSVGASPAPSRDDLLTSPQERQVNTRRRHVSRLVLCVHRW